ncbi:MAG: glutaminyl-peptide cyclotransferase [Thermoleophilales bacterium]|nr:glutaminyl-peptide cyclotransferase [Thermoleophilales bacterium]
MRTDWSLALASLLCATALVATGCGSDSRKHDSTAVKRAVVDRFDADSAYSLVEQQVAAGQRPAGSPQLRKLAADLRPMLPNGKFEPVPGEPGLRNIVGVIPGRQPGLLIGAHYDTLVKPKGFVGANNGAAGTAVVIEAARALEHARRPAGAPEIRFVLFDGEEPAAGLPEESADFYHSGLRGSRAYVKAHRGRTAAMVLLDYVGNKRLRLPREGSSTLSLWAKLRGAARAVGAAHVFPDEVGAAIDDDHTPFLLAHVPAIDLIDWSYRGHDLSDRLDKISRASLDAVGESVVELALRMR